MSKKSSRASGGVDKRVHRTRMALAEALMALGPEAGVDALEVGALTAKAGVGRSTFYKHYADKDDFFITSFAGMVGGFDAEARMRADYRAMLPAREVFAHVEEARAFALSLVPSGQFARTQGAREEKLRAIAEANLKRLHPRLPCGRRQELAVILAGGFASLMRWWMETGLKASAPHVAGLYETLAQRLLADEEKG